MRPGNGVSLRLRLISCRTFGHLANHAVRLSQTTKRSTKYMTRSKSWRSVQDWLDQISRGGELATSFTNSIFLGILNVIFEIKISMYDGKACRINVSFCSARFFIS
jgi:hypothetical protein